MSTDASNASSWLSVAELLKRYDYRAVGDLVADDDTRVSEASLATDDNLLAVIKDACGEIESACLRGEIYSAADLAALTGVSQGKLYRITSDLTMAYLWDRRGGTGDMPSYYYRAMEALDQLAKGIRIFSFAEQTEAGHLTHRNDLAEDFDNRKSTSSQASRLFGRRISRMSE